MSNYQEHPYHLVDPSPWPIVGAFSALFLTTGGVMYMHSYQSGGFVLGLGLLMLIYTMFVWWRDVIREATFEGHHTQAVQTSMRYGMALFIISEVMFFFAFFWAYFHSSLVPNIEIGGVWPPLGIEPFNPFGVPALNTVILLTSGFTVTWAHRSMVAGYRNGVVIGLVLTLILAVAFTGLQGLEYSEATFSITDGIYGSTFFLATGFHGLHVIIGTIFLTVCLFRQLASHFTRHHHFGFEAAAWYWHFVDVVWIFLFVTIYYWGSLGA